MRPGMGALPPENCLPESEDSPAVGRWICLIMVGDGRSYCLRASAQLDVSWQRPGCSDCVALWCHNCILHIKYSCGEVCRHEVCLS